MHCFSAAHCTDRRRESQTSRSRGSTGDVFQLNDKFFQKVARFVSIYLLWKKSRQKGLKLLNIVLKSRSCVSRVGRIDPNIDSIDTNVGIGIGSILA